LKIRTDRLYNHPVSAYITKEGVLGINPEILGQCGAQSFRSKTGYITVRGGVMGSAEVWKNGIRQTTLKPGKDPIKIRLTDGSIMVRAVDNYQSQE